MDTKFKAQTHDLNLELAWLTWVLHMDSLRQTFDQSLIKIFQRIHEIWSRQESVKEGQLDGRTDEGHFYTERKKKRRVEFFPSYFNHFLRCLL